MDEINKITNNKLKSFDIKKPNSKIVICDVSTKEFSINNFAATTDKIKLPIIPE